MRDMECLASSIIYNLQVIWIQFNQSDMLLENNWTSLTLSAWFIYALFYDSLSGGAVCIIWDADSKTR